MSELRALVEPAARLLVETHDSHPTGEAALRLVAPFADPAVAAVLWDAVHTWRAGENPARTRQVLGDHLGHFQVKDAGHDAVPVLPGTGEVPLDECGHALRSWSGRVSLEWERAWHPGVVPVEDALTAAAGWFRRWNPR